MPTNHPFATLTCCPSSGGKGSWPLGTVADVSDVCSNISSIGTTLAPHLCQASHCRRSLLTATATHHTVPERLLRLGKSISTMGRSREPRRSRDRGRRSRPRDNASDPGSAASSKGDGRNPNAPWLYGAWVKQKDRVSELETELKQIHGSQQKEQDDKRMATTLKGIADDAVTAALRMVGIS